MKKSKFSESQIVNILKEAEAGVSMAELSKTLISMTGWAGLSYPAIASFKVPLQGGNRSPNVFSKCEQSKAEKSGRVAGVGKSSLRPGSMV